MQPFVANIEVFNYQVDPVARPAGARACIVAISDIQSHIYNHIRFYLYIYIIIITTTTTTTIYIYIYEYVHTHPHTHKYINKHMNK